jgi:CRISPR-associated protein Cas2
VAKIMEGFGQRVQKSVFECSLDKSSFYKLQKQVESIINPQEDTVKYFYLCNKCYEKAILLGRGKRFLIFPEVAII